MALIARNAFCGWLCPFGFIQDMVSSFSIFDAEARAGCPQGREDAEDSGRRLAVLDRYLRFFKYGVLAWAVTGAAVYGFMVFRDVDPWAALWNLLELSLGAGHDRPGRRAGCLALRRAALVPLCLPAGRCDRAGQQAQPVLSQA